MVPSLIEKQNVTPEQAVKILEQNGVELDEKEVQKVLEMMYFFAKLIVNQNFKL
jgi:hypothetical protein